jgi:hypothetical protein
MQLFDIVACFLHMLARKPRPMIHLQLHGYWSDRPLSSHSVLPNFTLPVPGDLGQPLDSSVFQADRHSRSPLIHYNPWMF